MAEKKQEVVRKFGAFSSSIDPQQVALTWKGVAGFVVTAIVFLAPYFGVDFSGVDFNAIIKNVYDAILSAGLVVSSLAVAWGGIRKAIVAFKNRNSV